MRYLMDRAPIRSPGNSLTLSEIHGRKSLHRNQLSGDLGLRLAKLLPGAESVGVSSPMKWLGFLRWIH